MALLTPGGDQLAKLVLCFKTSSIPFHLQQLYTKSWPSFDGSAILGTLHALPLWIRQDQLDNGVQLALTNHLRAGKFCIG